MRPKERVISFVTDDKHIAFCDGSEVRYSAYNKLPDTKPELYKRTNDPRKSNVVDLCSHLIPNVFTDVIIKNTERMPINEVFDMQLGVGCGVYNAGYTDFALLVKADGFEISDKDKNSFNDEYNREYEILDMNDFFSNFIGTLSSDYIDLGDTNIYVRQNFKYREDVRLICNDKKERSGSIIVEVRGLENGKFQKYDHIDLAIYYATDGEYIAYSVESEDAAKRALYGDFGYFWRVTVPEFFGGD